VCASLQKRVIDGNQSNFIQETYYEQGTEIFNIQNRYVGLFFFFQDCEAVIFWIRQVVFGITHRKYTIQGTHIVHEADWNNSFIIAC
jgi:hypothetical protein